jgi:predicted CXXCH cytochrome family protein
MTINKNSKGFVFRDMSIVFCLMLSALCSLLCASSSWAKVTGYCSNCHTMHNSQNGHPVAQDFNGSSFSSTDTPKESLLIYSCLGCHSATDGTTWQDSATKAPIVFNTVEPAYGVNGLAAGNFFYVSGIVDDTGHNILATNPDGILGDIPPGGSFPSGGSYAGQLRCSGTRGCHGHNGGQSGDSAIDDETSALKGAHHGSDTPPLNGDLSDVARNYRFLLGIAGKEDSNWEVEPSNNAHNEYKGDVNFGVTNTISYLCGECHGNFHSDNGVGSASPWLRHPTDILLPQTGEYATYDPTTTYNNLVPVAYTDFENPSRPMAVVMCLSCHRAHASPWFKMMRWNYKSWPGSGTNGCSVCHTSKD